MDNPTAKALKIKQKALASFDERVRRERSRLERELATLDDRSRKDRAALEEEVVILSKAVSITTATVDAPPSSVTRGRTKQERDELFARRSDVMRRHLERASGKEVHVRDIAKELDRPFSTIKDYYNEQPQVRPDECFWENGIDGSHFRWKTPAAEPTASPLPPPRVDSYRMSEVNA